MKLTLKNIIISTIFIVAIFQRLSLFNQVGKDIYAYEKAVTDLLEGRNPYLWTIQSFSNPDDPGNHGFAYLPGLLYINAIGLIISLYTKIPFEYLWKIPVLLADIGIGIILVKSIKNPSMLIFSLLIWFFNPYFFLKHNYVYTDPIPVFFMMLALYYLGKDDVLSGSAYAFSVALKTFPLLLFPVFLIFSKNKLQFLLSCILVGFAVSIPFMGSIEDFYTYLRGSLFIHSERFVQGRPFLFYISYFYKIEFFQTVPFKVYTFLASFSGWILVTLLYFLKLIKEKYLLALIPFLIFYLFTPVLNRTYLIWFLPILLISLYKTSKIKTYYIGSISVWLFYYIYLLPWKDGFHIWHP